MTSQFDSTETKVRAAFEQLVGDEPPLRVDAQAAINASRRASRRRVVYRSSAAAAVAVIATAGFTTLAHEHNSGAPRDAAKKVPAETPALRLTASHGRVPVADGGQPQSALDAQMIAIIKATSPSGLSFKFGGGGTDQSSVDGTADDGVGPGRVYVWVSPTPGTMTREPCGDPEFVAGASCTETHLAGDAILSVRGLVDYQGIQTYEIALTHADGSGVGAEVGNFTLPPMPKLLYSTPQKRNFTRPTVTRPSPTYNAAQIATVVQAVDTAVHP